MGSKGDLHRIIAHVAAGRLKTVVAEVMPLDQVAAAHQLLEERKIFGKIVLKP